MTRLPDASIVRIFDANNDRVIGAGFLVSERHVFTCAHVVGDALGLTPAEQEQTPTANQTICLDFPLVKPDHPLQARVTAWIPPWPDGSGDIAKLELLAAPPRGAQPAPLKHVEDLWGHQFRAYGFPQGIDNGIWTQGKILGREATGWLQVEDTRQTGYFIQPGFSGGPAWDEQVKGVVGIIVAAISDADKRTAFVLPSELLEKAGDVGHRLAAILVELYNEQDFTNLCQLDNFIQVQSQFSLEMPQAQRASLLATYCERNGLRPELLEQIKKRNADRYRQFVANQVFHLIGPPPVSAEIDSSPAAIQQEYAQVIGAQPCLPPPIIEGMDDFSFHNRDKICARIIEDKPRYLELYGPKGSGKTHILRHIQERGANLRVAYLDCQASDADITASALLRQILEKLGGHGEATLNTLARRMAQLQRGEGVNHFIFAFDFDAVQAHHKQAIEWLVSPEGLLKSQDFEHQRLYQLLKNHGVAIEQLTVQIIAAAREPIALPNWSTKFNPRAIEITPLAPSEDLSKRDPVLLMLKEIAEKSDFEGLPDDSALEIANEVYYHTGGHPKCAKLLLYAVAKNDFLCEPPETNGWRCIFRQYVIPTIRDELLANVNPQFIPLFWMLSVFRQFNPHLLASLISRGFLPGSPGKKDRDYASELLGKLKDTRLIEDPEKGGLHTMNAVVRRTLSLGMQYFNPSRFRTLNTLALEIYTDWLQREPLTGERPIMIFVEIVYHCLKLLESEPAIKPKVQAAIANEYLPRLLQAIDHMDPEDYKNNRWSYLPQIKAYWNDKELIETARRATGNDDFHNVLTTLLEEFVEKNLS